MSELYTQSTAIQKEYKTPSAHYWVTLALALGLFPAFRYLGLPLHFAWADYFQTFWVGHGVAMVFGGSLFYIATVPPSESFGRFARHISVHKTRGIAILVMFLTLALILSLRVGFLVGLGTGLLAAAATILVFELRDRAEETGSNFARIVMDIFWPSAYMFVGMILLFAYNDMIASFRYTGSADLVLKRWDAALLGGHSISEIAHTFLAKWPGGVSWLQVVYLSMFAQVGGLIGYIAVKQGRRSAMQLVGAVVTAFYLALVLFYFVPGAGSFATCVNHFQRVPSGTMIYPLQQQVLTSLERFHAGQSIGVIGLDYYVAMPSIHLVLPLIVLWFVRGWTRVAFALIALDLLLIPSILLLEQHYLVDLIAAVPVAALVIALCGRNGKQPAGNP